MSEEVIKTVEDYYTEAEQASRLKETFSDGREIQAYKNEAGEVVGKIIKDGITTEGKLTFTDGSWWFDATPQITVGSGQTILGALALFSDSLSS